MSHPNDGIPRPEVMSHVRSDTQNGGDARRPRSRRIDALHVLTMCSIAVAQPLFDLLGRNASFFVAHRAQGAHILLLVAIALLGPAALLTGFRVLLDTASRRAGDIVHLASIGALGAIALVAPLVRGIGLSWILAVPLAVAVAAIIAIAYARTNVLRRFLTILSPAVIVFPALFLFASPVRDLLIVRSSEAQALPAAVGEASRTPVVFVVLDELSLPTVMTPDGEINARRFPGFARLAESSTWYPRATTVALRTDQAVPALLTGRRIARREIPSSYAHPNNVFRLLSRTHRLDVREFVTQLCPPDLCRGRAERSSTGLGPLLRDSAIVYAHIVTPPDLAERVLPPLGDRWGGFTRDPGARGAGGDGGDPVRSWLRSAIDERETQHEGRVFDDFLDDLRPARAKPALSYMHLQLPHPPWRYLPTGQTYPAGDTTPGYRNFRWGPDQYLATEVFQRSMLQTVYADRLVADLLDRLEELDVMDETLLIVTSDHGATWSANGTRREIGPRHRAGMLSVPIFVKYPEQQQGRIDERNAETIDIVPTIADVLDIDMPWNVDGSSLRGTERHGKQVFDLQDLRTIDVTFGDVRRRAAEVEELFGPGGGEDDLYGFGSHRAPIGRNIDQLQVSDAPSDFTIDIGSLAPYERVDVDQPVLPAFVRGDVDGDADAGTRYVVALNGVIAGAGQIYIEDERMQIAVMLSHDRFRNGRNAIAVYEVIETDRIRPIRLRP